MPTIPETESHSIHGQTAKYPYLCFVGTIAVLLAAGCTPTLPPEKLITFGPFPQNPNKLDEVLLPDGVSQPLEKVANSVQEDLGTACYPRWNAKPEVVYGSVLCVDPNSHNTRERLESPPNPLTEFRKMIKNMTPREIPTPQEQGSKSSKEVSEVNKNSGNEINQKIYDLLAKLYNEPAALKVTLGFVALYLFSTARNFFYKIAYEIPSYPGLEEKGIINGIMNAYIGLLVPLQEIAALLTGRVTIDIGAYQNYHALKQILPNGVMKFPIFLNGFVSVNVRPKDIGLVISTLNQNLR
jgi:hypothetical protein